MFANKARVCIDPREEQKRVQGLQSISCSLTSDLQPETKTNERKPGSVLNATKSSQAKMVQKVFKEGANTKYTAIRDKSRFSQLSASRAPASAERPVLKRSDTFLKDEPTFGDKTANVDENK